MLLGAAEATDKAAAMARADADAAVQNCLGSSETQCLFPETIKPKDETTPPRAETRTPPAIYRGQALVERFAKMREAIE